MVDRKKVSGICTGIPGTFTDSFTSDIASPAGRFSEAAVGSTGGEFEGEAITAAVTEACSIGSKTGPSGPVCRKFNSLVRVTAPPATGEPPGGGSAHIPPPQCHPD